jgi:hypothetical protein
MLLFRKLRTLLVLPAALFIGVIGWSVMWIDSEKSPRKNGRIELRDQEDNEAISFQLAHKPAESIVIEDAD